MARKIKGTQIIADLRAGMKGAEIMEKYDLAPHELRSVLRQVRLEREARIHRIAFDLMNGVPPVEVMEKHGISHEGLQIVLETFSVELALEMPDLSAQHSDVCDRVIIDFRSEPRHKPVGLVTAEAHACTIGECFLRDISEHGLALVGTRMSVEEIGKVSILGDHSGLVEPFELSAECRWAGTESRLGRPMAGFRITEISPSNSVKLREFMNNYTIVL